METILGHDTPQPRDLLPPSLLESVTVKAIPTFIPRFQTLSSCALFSLS